MSLERFCSESGLFLSLETDKVRLLAFFYLRANSLEEFTLGDACDWLVRLNLSRPNKSRLRNKLRRSNQFVAGTARDTFRLHAREISALDAAYPGLAHESHDVVARDTILPAVLYSGTRGFVESLARQINASYEHNIFDGCAVLMRRLVEVLLVLSYQHSGIESQVRDSSGEYKSLNEIIADAKSNPSLGLSKGTRACIDQFRILGNFSAHKVYYNAKRADIDKVSLEFRAAVEELLYKCAIAT